MFDAHCHFRTGDCIFRTGELLPQNISKDYDVGLVRSSEIGLDRRFSSVLSMDRQVEILKEILQYAENNGIAVTLHCVRETGLMLEILGKMNFEPLTVMWHGFTGSAETAARLHGLGVIISLGLKMSDRVAELYRANPYIVLETDYEGCDFNEYTRELEAHYERCAAALKMSVNELEKRCRELTNAFKS